MRDNQRSNALGLGDILLWDFAKHLQVGICVKRYAVGIGFLLMALIAASILLKIGISQPLILVNPTEISNVEEAFSNRSRLDR